MRHDPLPLLSFSPQEQCYTITQGAHVVEVTGDKSDWEAWLTTTSSFAFEGRDGRHYTVRKERLQRGDAYWYAYRSIQGRTKKRYLGRTADLTLTRIEAVGAHFAEENVQAVATTQVGQRLLPLLETKLNPPLLPTLHVERARLYDRLNQSTAHKLTLLLAPAGFGKTTLLAQWLATRSSLHQSATSWVSLEEADNDPLRFWHYIIMACLKLLSQEQQSTGRAALAHLSTTLQLPFDPSPIEVALTHLLNALSAPSCGGLLVLDDYHTIRTPGIHRALTFFIDHLPASVHVLLLSRTEPDLPLLRWRSRGEVSELRGTELRFSLEETTTFFQQALPIALSEAALIQLDRFLEGWAAGFRLLALTISGWRTPQTIEQTLSALSEHAEARNGAFPYRPLLDYFVSEILETQSEPMQRFLLYSSMLSRLCTPLCAAVISDAAPLEEAVRAGLFLEALEGSGEWYRYHALFAEAMRREATRRLGEEALQQVSRQASRWYEHEGMLAEAIEAALQAHDMQHVAHVLEQIDTLTFYAPQSMRYWLEQLPEEVLSEHPMLCHLFAVELRFPVELRVSAVPAEKISRPGTAERGRIEQLLHMAEDGWRRQGELNWIGANPAFRALSILVEEGPFSTLVRYAQQALSLLSQDLIIQEPPLRMYRASCRLFIGKEKLRLGQIREARLLLLQASEDNTSPGNRYLAADILLALGKSDLFAGELRNASMHLEQARSIARELGDKEMQIDALLELSQLAFERNDVPEAERLIHEARTLAEHTTVFSECIACQLALLHYAQGKTTTTLAQVNALLALLPRDWLYTNPWLVIRLREWQGRLRLTLGDTQTVQQSLDEPGQGGESLTEELEKGILRGRLWLAQGRHEAALQHCMRLLPLAQEHLHQYAALKIKLLLALIFAAGAQEEQAHHWLHQALSQAIDNEHLRIFLNEGRPMILLLRSLLKSLPYDTTLRLYVQRLLRAASQEPRSQPTDALFAPLTSQEQRILQLLVAGWNNQEIAHELVVSVNTVKYHTKHLYQKLGVSNRLQASEVARTLSKTLTQDILSE